MTSNCGVWLFFEVFILWHFMATTNEGLSNGQAIHSYILLSIFTWLQSGAFAIRIRILYDRFVRVPIQRLFEFIPTNYVDYLWIFHSFCLMNKLSKLPRCCWFPNILFIPNAKWDLRVNEPNYLLTQYLPGHIRYWMNIQIRFFINANIVFSL